MELQILALAPSVPTAGHGADGTTYSNDSRQRNNITSQNGYSERLDSYRQPSGIRGATGPILSSSGQPLRPFTLLDTRQRLQEGVFRPDHSLPTMTIDEYLAEERRRGGMIEGGGAASGIRPEPDEDNLEKADQETLKARAWDDFKDENPRGAGNTINRG
jgi:immunoglobulin-binding protein 1